MFQGRNEDGLRACFGIGIMHTESQSAVTSGFGNGRPTGLAGEAHAHQGDVTPFREMRAVGEHLPCCAHIRRTPPAVLSERLR